MSDKEERDAEKQAMKVTHNAIDDAVRAHLENVGIEGLVTGWHVVASITSMEDGDEYDGIYVTTSDGLTKWSTVGLLSVALRNAHEDGFL